MNIWLDRFEETDGKLMPDLLQHIKSLNADADWTRSMLIAEEEAAYGGLRTDETREERLARLLPDRPEIRKGLARQYIIGKKPPGKGTKHDTDDGHAANQ